MDNRWDLKRVRSASLVRLIDLYCREVLLSKKGELIGGVTEGNRG